jgi:hypothetical protein
MTMIPIQHRLKIGRAPVDLALRQALAGLRVAVPCIVVSFDEDKQTVSVQPAVTEAVRKDSRPVNLPLPQLDDVPVCFPTGGGWSLTLPIQAGDECDVVFQDMAFDLWWQNGGMQNQPDGVRYRHDIGDAIAFFGLRSQPRKLANYNTEAMQLRNDDLSVQISLATDQIAMKAPAVNIGDAESVQRLMTQAFLTWFVADVMPFLIAHGYTGPVPPMNSVTTILEAE